MEVIQKALEQLLLQKFVSVKSFLDVPVLLPSKFIIVDHSMFIIWMIHLLNIQVTVHFDTFFTVWKFQDFFVIQILREINYEESRSAKSAVFVICGGSDIA